MADAARSRRSRPLTALPQQDSSVAPLVACVLHRKKLVPTISGRKVIDGRRNVDRGRYHGTSSPIGPGRGVTAAAAADANRRCRQEPRRSRPASKAFLVKLSESITAEHERHGVRSTVALQGPMRTEFIEVAGLTDYFDDRLLMSLSTMAPEPVSRKVHEASAKGRRVVVTGAANRAAAALFVHTPPRLRYALSRLTADAGQPGASPLPEGADLSSDEAMR
jgi:hypothetical protein